MINWHIHWEIAIQLGMLLAASLLAIGPLRHRFVYADIVRPSRSRVWLFTLGVLVIFLAEATPIHELSEQYLFSMHMTQHMLLVLLAIPLMMLGTPAWLIGPDWPKHGNVAHAVSSLVARQKMQLDRVRDAAAQPRIPGD